MTAQQLIVYGATGTTGRQVVKLAVDAGMRPVVTGRNATLLRELANKYGLEARVADMSNKQLDAAFAGATVVVSCAGPYTHFGAPVVEAAIRRGAHYVDFTGEPRYIKRLLDEYDQVARTAGSVLVPASGIGAATNLAARVAATGINKVDRITVSYKVRAMKQSTGTRQSVFELMVGGAPVLDRGRLSFIKAGSRITRLRRGLGVIFPLTDPLTLSRVWPQASIESYMQTPLAPVTRLLLPTLMTFAASPALAKVLHWLEARTHGVSAEEACGFFEITVKVQGDGKVKYGIAEVADIYAETAQAGFEVACRLLSEKFPAGLRASGEVLGDTQETAARIGVQLSTIEG